MTRDDAIKRLGEHLSEDYRAMTDDGDAWLDGLASGRLPYCPLADWVQSHDEPVPDTRGTGVTGLLTELLLEAGLPDHTAASASRRRAALVLDLGYELAYRLDTARQDRIPEDAAQDLYRLSDPWAAEAAWCEMIGAVNEGALYDGSDRTEDIWGPADVDAILRTHPRALLREAARTMARNVWGEHAAAFDEQITVPGVWWAEAGTAVYLCDAEDAPLITDDGPAREASQELRARDLPLGTSVLYGDGTLQPVLLG